MSTIHILIAVAAFVIIDIFLLMFFSAGIYNGLISLKKQVDRAWANIDVVLKERHDLIPQLVNVIEQYTQYERGTLDKLIEARKSYGTGSRNDQIKSDQTVSAAIKGIFALGEGYPELKSSDQFVQLESTLANLEKQLADRRELFNDSATNFNTRIEQIPDVFFARILGFSASELYRVAPSERQAPSTQIKLPA